MLRPLARVAELADAPDLGSGAARRGGSSPSSCTKAAKRLAPQAPAPPVRRRLCGSAGDTAKAGCATRSDGRCRQAARAQWHGRQERDDSQRESVRRRPLPRKQVRGRSECDLVGKGEAARPAISSRRHARPDRRGVERRETRSTKVAAQKWTQFFFCEFVSASLSTGKPVTRWQPGSGARRPAARPSAAASIRGSRGPRCPRGRRLGNGRAAIRCPVKAQPHSARARRAHRAARKV